MAKKQPSFSDLDYDNKRRQRVRIIFTKDE